MCFIWPLAHGLSHHLYNRQLVKLITKGNVTLVHIPDQSNPYGNAPITQNNNKNNVKVWNIWALFNYSLINWNVYLLHIIVIYIICLFFGFIQSLWIQVMYACVPLFFLNGKKHFCLAKLSMKRRIVLYMSLSFLFLFYFYLFKSFSWASFSLSFNFL